MADLNSVLIEGELLDCKGKKDRTGWWMLIRSRAKNSGLQGRTTFRVDLPLQIQEKLNRPLTQGSRLRVIGKLANASRIGAFVRVEHLEFHPMSAAALL